MPNPYSGTLAASDSSPFYNKQPKTLKEILEQLGRWSPPEGEVAPIEPAPQPAPAPAPVAPAPAPAPTPAPIGLSPDEQAQYEQALGNLSRGGEYADQTVGRAYNDPSIAGRAKKSHNSIWGALGKIGLAIAQGRGALGGIADLPDYFTNEDDKREFEKEHAKAQAGYEHTAAGKAAAWDGILKGRDAQVDMQKKAADTVKLGAEAAALPGQTQAKMDTAKAKRIAARDRANRPHYSVEANPNGGAGAQDNVSYDAKGNKKVLGHRSLGTIQQETPTSSTTRTVTAPAGPEQRAAYEQEAKAEGDSAAQAAALRDAEKPGSKKWSRLDNEASAHNARAAMAAARAADMGKTTEVTKTGSRVEKVPATEANLFATHYRDYLAKVHVQPKRAIAAIERAGSRPVHVNGQDMSAVQALQFAADHDKLFEMIKLIEGAK